MNITDSYEDFLREALEASPASLEQQYEGIDLLLEGITVSVKNQVSTLDTGNYAFEESLVCSGRITHGAFLRDASQVTIMTAGDGMSHFFETARLKRFVRDTQGRHVRLKQKTIADNRSQGRTFTDAIIKLFPADLINCLAFFSCKNSEVNELAGVIEYHMSEATQSVQEKERKVH